jgi:hypothetical protein
MLWRSYYLSRMRTLKKRFALAAWWGLVDRRRHLVSGLSVAHLLRHVRRMRLGRLFGGWARVVFEPAQVQPESSQHQVCNCRLFSAQTTARTPGKMGENG